MLFLLQSINNWDPPLPTLYFRLFIPASRITIPLSRFSTWFINNFRLTTFHFQFLSLRNDIMVLLSREDIFASRENLSLHEEELDVNRLDYYQVGDSKQVTCYNRGLWRKWLREILNSITSELRHLTLKREENLLNHSKRFMFFSRLIDDMPFRSVATVVIVKTLSQASENTRLREWDIWENSHVIFFSLCCSRVIDAPRVRAWRGAT